MSKIDTESKPTCFGKYSEWHKANIWQRLLCTFGLCKHKDRCVSETILEELRRTSEYELVEQRGDRLVFKKRVS